MALNIDLFKKVVAPEYSAMTAAELALFVIEAELEVAVPRWGKFAPRAVALMTAHLIKLSGISKDGEALSPSKQLKKTKVGDLVEEYQDVARSTKGADSLDITVYGQEYTRLRKKILKTPLFVGP